jgi:hypothetical protein
MGDLMKATITLADDPIIKGNRISIKAVSGGSYSFFKTKKDGTNSAAYQGMESMGLKKDMTVNIAYDTTEGEFNGKKIQYKNIKAFQEPSIQVGEPNPRPNVSPKAGVDWDKISWGKCRHAFLVEAYKMGKSLIDAKNESSEWADVSMSEKEVDVEDIDVSKIPF